MAESTVVQSVQALQAAGFSVSDEVLLALNHKVLAIDQILRIQEGRIEDFRTNLPLLPYQTTGAAFLTANGGGLLADSVGLGKTIQALAACEKLRIKDSPKSGGTVLWLTMASLKYQTRNEIKKFVPNARVIIIEGTKKEREHLYNQPAEYYIVNYELLLRDDVFKKASMSVIVCDEATRLSNTSNKQVRELRSIKAPHKIALTGTPVSNSPLDVYGILEWTKPGCLGNFKQFVERYVVKDIWGGTKYFKNLGELATRIKPYYLRRTQGEVLPDLPEKREVEILFLLSAIEKKVYEKIKLGIIMELEALSVSKIANKNSLISALPKMEKLQELVDSLELIGESTESSKLEVLKELINKLLI